MPGTTLTGPLTIKKALNSDQVDVIIGASGTSRFTGPILIGASAAGRVDVRINSSGTALFSGPIVVGVSGGATQVGRVELVQRATLVAIHSAGNPLQFSVPSASDIIDIWLSIEAPIQAAVATAMRIGTYLGGTGVSAASLISEIGVSASGSYNLTRTPTVAGNANLLRNVTATLNVFQSMKALDSAATTGQGILTVKYIQYV